MIHNWGINEVIKVNKLISKNKFDTFDSIVMLKKR